MQVENGSVEALGSRIVENVGRVLVGKAAEIELCVIALLSRGHILIEDVPGVGKTMLAKSLARSLGCSFERLQFTPDLLPSDVTGVNIYSPSTQQFEFRQGPIFTQVLLADEINRATPKTQSALLEAMEERQVTVDGTTYPLSLPFLVLATQNPVEFAGTFPLPEAQVDRFLMRVNLGYLDVAHEVQVLDRFQRDSSIEQLPRDGAGAAAQRRVAVRTAGGQLAGAPMRLPRLPLLTALALLFFFAYITGIRLAYSLLYALVLLFVVSYFWSRLAANNLE